MGGRGSKSSRTAGAAAAPAQDPTKIGFADYQKADAAVNPPNGAYSPASLKAEADGTVSVRTRGTNMGLSDKEADAASARRRAATEAALKPAGFGVQWNKMKLGERAGQLGNSGKLIKL